MLEREKKVRDVFLIILLVVCPTLLGIAIDIESWTLGLVSGSWFLIAILAAIYKAKHD